MVIMSDLRIPNVPLAKLTEDCDLDEDLKNRNNLTTTPASLSAPSTPRRSRNNSRGSPASSGEMEGCFGEGNDGGSLEDLVGHFDEKITECFKNYQAKTEQLAPVQVRTQEEIMSESQIWWTLTGNFGNILPLDWSKTQARKLQIPTLNLRPKREGGDEENNLDLSDDEELAAALDLHSLIVSSALATPHDTPPQTADQVIEEIDEIMQGSSASELTGTSDQTMESAESLCSPLKSPLPMLASIHDPELEAKVREAAALASDEEKLQHLPYTKLLGLQGELESLIQAYNESLVQELALKDELEYEKELKNTFISLILSIQNKRRQYMAERKKRTNTKTPCPGLNGTLPQYITTTIPFQEGGGPPDNQTLQALIKILRAVDDDNPNVPNMLTDYILNVLCPSATLTPTAALD